MTEWLPVLLGLGAASLWGTADFFAKGMAEKDGSEIALFWLYLVGFPIFVVAWIGSGAGAVPWATSRWWLVAGLMNAVGYLALYRGFKVGLLAVVSTTNAAWAAITVLLSVFFWGESPHALAVAGILFTLVGVVLIAYPGGRWSLRAPGFKEGLASACLFGTSFFLLKNPEAQGNVLAQAMVMRGTGLLVVLGVLFQRGVAPRTFVRPPPFFAFLDTAGFLCFIGGLSVGASYIVAPLGSLLTPIVVALAAIFLHERLKAHQWIGFASVVTGALLLGAS